MQHNIKHMTRDHVDKYRVLAAVFLLFTLVLVGVLAGATGTVLLSLRITVGCLAVLFRRMDPDREDDPEKAVVVWQKLIGIEADSDVAHEKSSGVMNDGWLSIAGTCGSLPGGFLRR